MNAVASGHFWRNIQAMIAETFSPVGSNRGNGDWWAGRRFTIVGVDEAKVTLKDESGHVETVELGYGARQTISGATLARGLASPLGLVIFRERFAVDGVSFWRWAVRT
jgi:hypothetical protein